MSRLTSTSVLAPALLVAGVLIFADASAVRAVGFVGTVVLLLVLGYRGGGVGALAWALVLVASAVIADGLWQADWEPFNRSEDYEAIPQTPFVLLGLPLPMGVIGVGVLACWLRRRRRGGPSA